MIWPVCVACASTDDLDDHHLIPRSAGGTDDETNLITLCHECHGKIHGVKWNNNHGKLIRDGIKKARYKGISWGRPKLDPAIINAIRTALEKGDKSIHKIAREFGVGTGTVQRIKAGMTG